PHRRSKLWAHTTPLGNHVAQRVVRTKAREGVPFPFFVSGEALLSLLLFHHFADFLLTDGLPLLVLSRRKNGLHFRIGFLVDRADFFELLHRRHGGVGLNGFQFGSLGFENRQELHFLVWGEVELFGQRF